MAPDKPSIDHLLAVEARLDRAFAICVVAVLMRIVWPIYLQGTDQWNRSWALPVDFALMAVMLVAYVWYAVAVRGAARALGKPGWPFLVWVLGAPFFSLIPAPFVGMAIAASPLALKFYFSGQLRSEIHDRTFAED